jgi:hypothetical protein
MAPKKGKVILILTLFYYFRTKLAYICVGVKCKPKRDCYEKNEN